MTFNASSPSRTPNETSHIGNKQPLHRPKNAVCHETERWKKGVAKAGSFFFYFFL